MALTPRRCWLSGWTDSFKPEGWYGPWCLQRAHLASGGARSLRVDDDRAVILLCPLAHDLHVSNADSFPSKVIDGVEYPTIDERHSLWLKREMDWANWDPEFIAKYWIGIPPEPEPPPEFWRIEYFKRTGILR